MFGEGGCKKNLDTIVTMFKCSKYFTFCYCYKRFNILGAVFTTSRYGKPVIMMGNYRYNKYCKSKGPRALWRCSSKSSNTCPATLTTVDDVIVKVNNKHSH